MRKLTLAIFTAAAFSAPAFADASVEDAYYAGVAAQKCGLELSAEQSSLLGDAVQRAEQASGLAAGDLDTLWKKVNAEADKDTEGFCGAHKAAVEKTLAAAK
jgi:hypothetical protein